MTAALSSQRGLALISLLSRALWVCVVVYLLVQILPTVFEARNIQGIIDRLASAPLVTVPEIRSAFDRQCQIELGIHSVKDADLVITKEDDHVVIRHAYDKEIELFSPVSLLINYAGHSK